MTFFIVATLLLAIVIPTVVYFSVKMGTVAYLQARDYYKEHRARLRGECRRTDEDGGE